MLDSRFLGLHGQQLFGQSQAVVLNLVDLYFVRQFLVFESIETGFQSFQFALCDSLAVLRFLAPSRGRDFVGSADRGLGDRGPETNSSRGPLGGPFSES